MVNKFIWSIHININIQWNQQIICPIDDNIIGLDIFIKTKKGFYQALTYPGYSHEMTLPVRSIVLIGPIRRQQSILHRGP